MLKIYFQAPTFSNIGFKLFYIWNYIMFYFWSCSPHIVYIFYIYVWYLWPYGWGCVIVCSGGGGHGSGVYRVQRGHQEHAAVSALVCAVLLHAAALRDGEHAGKRHGHHHSAGRHQAPVPLPQQREHQRYESQLLTNRLTSYMLIIQFDFLCFNMIYLHFAFEWLNSYRVVLFIATFSFKHFSLLISASVLHFYCTIIYIFLIYIFLI